jgi:hypothetical protein
MRKYIAIVILSLVAYFAFALALIHHFTDPAQQVRDGFRNARAACVAGMDRTPREHQLCKELLK